ncbi:hypothetical protein ACQPZX_15555 [Actinoplanes sp. CA-142083]|uniref:hypothetical protein n=1 Tax=Actinoplanes sp. CA-142083 TaxID=3239903 RepID=UPI003D8BA396
MNEIPREVEVAVRAAASATGGYAGKLDNVYRRARRNRRRRLAATSAGVATVVALAGVALALRSVEKREPALPPATGLPSPSAEVPAQRLMLDGANGVYESGPGLTVDLSGTTRVGELVPGDEILPHWVDGADGWDRFVGLDDGRIVALGAHDLMPGTPRSDGVDVEGLQINLVVTAADGAVQLKRDVRRKGEAVSMLTADSTAAYLWRPAGLVEHDLGSGRERVLVPHKALGGGIRAADLVGNRLVLVRDSAPCTPVLFDTILGQQIDQFPLPTLSCAWVGAVRLSPDGERVALTYGKSDRAQGERVTGIRFSDRAILVDQWIASRGGKVDQPLVSFAWQDATTLRGAVVPVGPGTSKITPFLITTS